MSDQQPTPQTIQRALRLLESHRRSMRAYYQRNKEAIKARATAYWLAHKDTINARRGATYDARRAAAAEALEEAKAAAEALEEAAARGQRGQE